MRDEALKDSNDDLKNLSISNIQRACAQNESGPEAGPLSIFVAL